MGAYKHFMLRREVAITDKGNEAFKDDLLNASKHGRLKVSNLTPYLTEIEVFCHGLRRGKSNVRTCLSQKKI